MNTIQITGTRAFTFIMPETMGLDEVFGFITESDTWWSIMAEIEMIGEPITCFDFESWDGTNNFQNMTTVFDGDNGQIIIRLEIVKEPIIFIQ